MNKNTQNLLYRLADASIASCTCGAHTSVFQFHRELCHYRLMEEAREEIRSLSGSSDGLVRTLQDECDELERENGSIASDLEDAEDEIDRLKAQLNELRDDE